MAPTQKRPSLEIFNRCVVRFKADITGCEELLQGDDFGVDDVIHHKGNLKESYDEIIAFGISYKDFEQDDWLKAEDALQGCRTTYTQTLQKLNRWERKLQFDKQRCEIAHYQRLKELKAPSCPLREGTTSSSASFIPVLPRMDLPSFSGDITEFASWFESFRAIIHDQELNSITKFTYLRSCLKGAALGKIASLNITDDNYQEALTILEESFGRGRIVVASLVRQLIELPRASNSARELHDFHNSVSNIKRALKCNGVDIDHDNTRRFVLPIMELKLPPVIRDGWEKHVTTSNDDCVNFVEFLRHVSIGAKVAESRGSAVISVKRFSNKTSMSKCCPNCSGASHELWRCPVFRTMRVSDRLRQARKIGVCFLCLNSGHAAGGCNLELVCAKCKGKHNTLLHSEALECSTGISRQLKTDCEVVSNSGHASGHGSILLMTARTEAVSLQTRRRIRVMIDEGSQVSLITKRLARDLGLRGSSIQLQLSGVAGMEEKSRSHYHHEFSLQTEGGLLISMSGVEVDKISDYANPVPRCVLSYPHFRGLRIADDIGKPGKVEVLIGADMISRFLTSVPLKVGRPEQPYAKHTSLGWIVCGNIESGSKKVRQLSCHLSANVDLSQFWRIEGLGPSARSVRSCEELGAEDIFSRGVRRREDGRIEAPLPLMEGFGNMKSTKALALKRFNRLESSFRKNTNLERSYRETMENNLNLDFIEEIPKRELNDDRPVCYLPHHSVIKKSSSTTKLRVVFDGSMTTSQGVSLNSQLFIGPKLQPDLVDILFRWRFKRIALSADIAKMYSQVALPRSQMDLLRFFWRPTRNGPIHEYRHTRQVFGIASAAHSCISAVQWNASKFKNTHKKAVEVILGDMYVDDLLTGADTLEEARTLVDQLRMINSYGHFELRKWCSNRASVIRHLDDHLLNNQESALIFEQTKALGYLWNPKSDCISLYIPCDWSKETLTKRIVLSESAKCFDPLGIFCPVFFVAKLIFQETWNLKLGWDEELPPELESKWTRWRDDVKKLKDFRVPRYALRPASYHPKVELCVFGDASKKGYAAVLYIRLIYTDQHIETSLLAAKSKVKPRKEISIPRLELEAALLSARLISHFLEMIPLKVATVRAWTDSAVVFYWIQKEPSTWKTYVANRVQRIQEIIEPSSWKHIAGTENPADIASRGSSAANLLLDKSWIQGPHWLSLPEHRWPTGPLLSDKAPELEFEKKKHSHQVNVKSVLSPLDRILDKFSCFVRVQRAVAWLRRLVLIFSSAKVEKNVPLSVQELEQATICLIRHEQMIYFPEQFGLLATGKAISHIDRLCRLDPIWDENNNLIRVGGRLGNIQFLSHNARHPFLVPKRSRLANLLVDMEHKRLLHSGVNHTLASLRQKYWIIQGRQLVSSRLRKCVVCQKFNARPLRQKMGRLPAFRAEFGPPFHQTGVDFAGPIVAHPSKRSSRKMYICLFTDLSSRAVHLELAESLTSADFIVAFRRFVCRRGIPRVIWSDHGRNFVGSSQIIRRFFEKEKSTFIDWASARGIEWKFIPPRAPHQGGVWETMVKLTKRLLMKQFGSTRLTPRQLETAIISIESVVNSRPLVALSDDSGELVLTPSMLMTGYNITDIPDRLVEEHLSSISRWRKLSDVLQRFRKTWMSQYILDHQKRVKWRHPSRNLQKNDVVVLVEELKGRQEWPMGRIMKTYTGGDGLVRSADIKSSNGNIYHRPIHRIVLVMPSNDNENQK